MKILLIDTHWFVIGKFFIICFILLSSASIKCKSGFNSMDKTYIHPTPEMPIGFLAGAPNKIPNISATIIMDQIYESLFYYDDDFNLKPLLVENWQVSSDSKEYKLFLKKGVLFHDESEMKADDVIYTLQKYSAIISSELGTIFSKPDTISKCGEYCIDIRLSKPCPHLIRLLAGRCLKIVPKNSLIENNVPVGTGVYMITSKGADFLVLSRFKKYREPTNSNIKDIYIKNMGKKEAIGAFKNRLVDDLFEYELMENEATALVGNKTRLPLLGINYIGMNTKLAPFNNRNLRLAIQYAVDKNDMFEKFFKGQLKIYGLIPKGLAGSFRADYIYPYSLEKAKELVFKSKVKLPIKIDFWIREMDYNEAFVNEFSMQMKQLGLILNIMRKSNEEFYDAYFKRNQQMFVTPLYVEYPEASHILNCFKSDSDDNDVLISSPEVDKKLTDLSFETNKLRRAEMYANVEEKILEEAAIIPLYQRVAWYIYNAKINGVRLPNLGSINLQINKYSKNN